MDISAIFIENTNFVTFGVTHLAAVFTFTLLAIALIRYGQKANPLIQQRIANGIAWTLFGTIVVWTLLEIVRDVLDPKIDLPVDLCNVNSLLIPLALVKRNKFWAQNLYYWVMAGTLQGVITPAIWEDFPHYTYFKFFITHCGLMVAVLYAAFVMDLRPTYRGLWQSFGMIHVYGLFALCANLLLDANYGFMCHKPATGSLLDYLGPHPWYLLSMEGIALVLMHLLWLPWGLAKQKESAG